LDLSGTAGASLEKEGFQKERVQKKRKRTGRNSIKGRIVVQAEKMMENTPGANNRIRRCRSLGGEKTKKKRRHDERKTYEPY